MEEDNRPTWVKECSPFLSYKEQINLINRTIKELIESISHPEHNNPVVEEQISVWEELLKNQLMNTYYYEENE